MEVKYRLLPKKRITGTGLPWRKSKLYQIEALRDIPRYGVKAGDLGGYVSSADCLSQEGDCWIREGSIVLASYGMYDSVIGNALIEGSYLIENSTISHEVVISGHDGKIMNSEISGTSKIIGKTEIDFCHFKHDVHVEHSGVETSLAANVYLFVDHEAIVINGSTLHDARIVGYGKLRVEECQSMFELEGGFDIELYEELDAAFKARGKVRIEKTEIIDCPVNLSGDVKISSSTISGSKFDMETERGTIQHSTFEGMTKISGSTHIQRSKFEGDNTLDGRIVVGPMSSLRGKNTLLGETILPFGSYLMDSTISDGQDISQKSLPSTEDNLQKLGNNLYQNIRIGVSDTPVKSVALPNRPVEIAANSDHGRIQEHINLIQSIEADYEAYTTDIVKLIKYPAMGDSSVLETRNFVVALRAAQRAVKANHTETLGTLAVELEHAFVEAESKAIILATSFMDDKRKQSLKKAGSALAIALDEKANEHERRAGYKSGMKSLEGVLPVSEKAVFALKERIGLKEIEA